MADNYMPTFANFKDPVTGQWIAFPAIKGDPGTPGEDGKSGVYYGTTTPTDSETNVWINPDGDTIEVVTKDECETVIDEKINDLIDNDTIVKNTDGKIEVDKSNFLSSDNIKTINGQSLIGEGDIHISGGTGGDTTDCVKYDDLDGTTIYKGNDNKIHAVGGGGTSNVSISYNSETETLVISTLLEG